MPTITIHSAKFHAIDLKTRMPFKYGIATMTSFPLGFITLHADVNGKPATGMASDLLPPKWFKKDPDQAPEAELNEMRQVIEHACNVASGLRGETVFDCWESCYQHQGAWGNQQKHPPLLAHFGSSLIERALIDAFCRHHQITLFRALKENMFGIRVHHIHPELNESSITNALPPSPLPNVIARHTVGLSDPLTDSDIPAQDRLHDGLPQSLEACCQRYGLKHLKVKICGDFDTDRQRLLDIAAIMSEQNPDGFAFTLDGNEQFEAMAPFKDYWDRLTNIRSLNAFMHHLLFVEQPVKRDAAISQEVSAVLQAWHEKPPIIIDESDGTLESAREAMRIGYAGTSHKNCKGVIKSIANRAWIHHLNTQHAADRYIMSGEDLCNQGPIAVTQDLCVAAALGIESVERNGHHYCAGLSDHPISVQTQMMESHGDVYERSKQGWPTLRIQSGRISMESINKAPFGMHNLPDLVDYMDL